jgi:hypothetical protein
MVISRSLIKDCAELDHLKPYIPSEVQQTYRKDVAPIGQN